MNDLAYPNNMIIFLSTDLFSLQLIMEVLRKHEKTYGQRINKEMCSMYIHHNVPGDISITVEVATGIGRKEFPFTYLGNPISYRRRKRISTSLLYRTYE